MSGDLVLLTGSTGFVGFAVLIELLEQGYKVRLVVRSESKIAAIKKALPSKYAAEELDFVVVSNIAKAGALDSSVKGAVYIVHVASPGPAPAEDFEAAIIKPALDNTMGILRSAAKEPSVKKIVITSSIAAIFPTTANPELFDADHVEPNPEGPFTDPFFAYIASKKVALNATRNFIAEEKPHFSIINVLPSFVVGRNGFATTKEEYEAGSNAVPLAPLLGKLRDHPTPGCACHIDDVAAVHVEALRPDVSGNHNFGVMYDGPDGIQWNDAIEIVKRRLPDVVAQGIFPMGGAMETQKLPFVASKTESVLGIKFKPFEDMIVDLARDYARLAAATSS